jgi:hypothetical protein
MPCFATDLPIGPTCSAKVSPIGPSCTMWAWAKYHANSNGKLVPDLLRGKGRSIGRDLDVGEEGSEQMIITLQSLHHDSVGYQHAHTRVGLAKNAEFLQMQPRTHARTEKNATKLADEYIAHECGVLQTIEW